MNFYLKTPPQKFVLISLKLAVDIYEFIFTRIIIHRFWLNVYSYVELYGNTLILVAVRHKSWGLAAKLR